MSNSKNAIVIFCLIITILFSCAKPAGEGGTSRIKGRVFIRNYNNNYTLLNSAHYGMEERVYVIYGNNDFYNDDIRTSYDGTYVFDNLRKGEYTIFAYSEDSTSSPLGQLYPVFQTVEITEEYQTVEIPTIVLLR